MHFSRKVDLSSTDLFGAALAKRGYVEGYCDVLGGAFMARDTPRGRQAIVWPIPALEHVTIETTINRRWVDEFVVKLQREGLL